MNNNLFHLYSTCLGTQSALHRRGNLNHRQCAEVKQQKLNNIHSELYLWKKIWSYKIFFYMIKNKNKNKKICLQMGKTHIGKDLQLINYN